MEMNRVWAMPNKNTFDIKAINNLIQKWKPKGIIVDPFANKNKIATITNDLDPQYNTDYHMDALDFLKTLKDNSVDMVLYDPPFSARQTVECYKKFDKTVNMQTTQSSYWSNQKKEISRILKKDGVVISCCWNSGGIGKKYGFEIQEILLVAHGGWHNDTICTVEKKVIGDEFMDKTTKETIDKNEYFCKKAREIANMIEDFRIEVFQNSIDEEKEEVDNQMFKLQSDMRDIANILNYSDFT